MQSAARLHLRANLLMLAAALIWGSAFVAQRLSLDAIGPFLFTGLRFLLGAGVVTAFVLVRRRVAVRPASDSVAAPALFNGALLRSGAVLGIVLAVAISLQQIGLGYTKIANAGFISSLYVVIVPMLGILLRHRTGVGTWLGAALAAVGLYFLSINEHFSVMYGDWYQLGCALVISIQVMLVGHYAPRHDPLALSIVQFVACGVVCLAIGLVCEPLSAAAIVRAAPTILYGGALSVGVGYTLQVVAQRDAAPAHAAVIFSMEGVFAALAGWAALGETLTPRALAGCALMLTGLLACQLVPAWQARVLARQRAATQPAETA
ncbi:EamA-like transporter family protein [Paraburkholderia unamae]|uniref:EamA-like transporter family protein n=2 Tax=Paraburkholderia unamae TaxID=219649 RepID=A0ABX5KY73_9BURK|nr:EamA-like transporter family protein [Paraburkholderia unamae]CAG9256124.1 Permease of the drug/metabolite transporter (DMT) superfamily [Paraburkholderia unamae]